MAVTMRASTASRLHIDNYRAKMLDEYVTMVRDLDEATEWSQIITAALEAGLEKADLAREFAVAPTTIFRWQKGSAIPSPFLRRAIKSRLIERLEEEARERSQMAVSA